VVDFTGFMAQNDEKDKLKQGDMTVFNIFFGNKSKKGA
jgi:hypothetical protein